MSGWRGSGGRGCRRLLQEIWQKMSGEKGSGIRKGSRLKQRFSVQGNQPEENLYQRPRGPVAPKLLFDRPGSSSKRDKE